MSEKRKWGREQGKGDEGGRAVIGEQEDRGIDVRALLVGAGLKERGIWIFVPGFGDRGGELVGEIARIRGGIGGIYGIEIDPEKRNRAIQAITEIAPRDQGVIPRNLVLGDPAKSPWRVPPNAPPDWIIIQQANPRAITRGIEAAKGFVLAIGEEGEIDRYLRWGKHRGRIVGVEAENGRWYGVFEAKGGKKDGE